MDTLYKEHTYICWIVSGILFGLSFTHSYLWVLYIPALWIFLELFMRSTTLTHVFFGTWIVGCIKAAGGISWIWSVYPLEWMGLSRGIGQFFLIFVYWSITAIAIGLGFAVVFSCCKYVVRKFSYTLMLFPLWWIVADSVGALLFSLYSLGPGSSLNFNFSFGYLGYAIADIPFLSPVAIFGGVFALTFVAVAMVVVVFLFYKNTTTTPRVFQWTVGLLVIFFIGIYILYPLPKIIDSGINVIAINTSFTNDMLTTSRGYIQKETAIISAVQTALQYDTDIILLPEDSRFTLSFESTQEALSRIQVASKGKGVTVVDSTRFTDQRGETILRAFIYDTITDTVSVVDKQYLVPQGEFISYLHGFFISLFTTNKINQTLNKNQSYRPGLEKSYKDIPTHIPPVLFCSESILPFGVRTLLSKHHSPLVLHPISHGWFHDSSVLTLSLARMLKIQALWNGVNIIEAGNMKEGVLYKKDGSIVEGVVLEEDELWKISQYTF